MLGSMVVDQVHVVGVASIPTEDYSPLPVYTNAPASLQFARKDLKMVGRRQSHLIDLSDNIQLGKFHQSPGLNVRGKRTASFLPENLGGLLAGETLNH